MQNCRALLFCLLLSSPARAQPADCAPTQQSPSQISPASENLPMQLNLDTLPGVPAGIGGQIYVAVPLGNGGMTCTDRREPPRDVLRGEPGDLLRGPVQ